MSKRNQRKSKKEVVNINFRRQKDIFDPQIFQKTITIVGLGNIGSQTAVALTRLGLKDFYLYDHDNIEEHNIASQVFYRNQLGKPKTEMIKKTMFNINKNVSVLAEKKKYDGVFLFSDILIIAVDSMKERVRIWKNLLKNNIRPELIIDGRMGGPQLEIYTCRTLEEWEDTFVDNPSKDPCGARSICYISMIIGSLIANQVKRYLKAERYKKTILFNIDSLQLI
jgi:molybdopterin/thiamine biosynthesis adenylyltransferase